MKFSFEKKLKLKLKLSTLNQLDKIKQKKIKGGFTQGCTDGCGIFGSYWNCTEHFCTNNAHGGLLPHFNQITAMSMMDQVAPHRR